MLFRSFSKSCSPNDLRLPAWDVALVLQSLTDPPYEPLKTVEERFLAQKTLFMIALGSAKRVGELHALSYRVSHSVGWKEGSFSFVPGFVAKTQDQSSRGLRVSRYQPHLSRTGLQMGDSYVGASGQVLPDPQKEISKNTVSFWLRKVISRAYQLSGKALPAPSPLAWETRGIAPSLLFRKNYAVNQVLKAGTWRCHTTFNAITSGTCHTKSLDTFHLGPVVAAQAMV